MVLKYKHINFLCTFSFPSRTAVIKKFKFNFISVVYHKLRQQASFF